MNEWIKNLLCYEKENDIGACPYCTGRDIELLELNQGRKVVSFFCKNCGKSNYFDSIIEKETR